MTKGRPIHYSDAERDWLQEHRALPRRDLHERFCDRFDRGDVSPVNIHSLCKRMGWLTGRTGQFEKGAAPHNKGRPMPSHPNSVRTQFKKGEMSGRAAQLVQPIGAERVTREGYLERKVNNDLPFRSRWKQVHRINWEAVNGPIPAGHVLKCLDGDRLHVSPENWLAVPRSILPRLNGRWTGLAYDDAADAVKPLMITTALLDDEVRRVTGATA